jgi:hypothetical protein
MKLFTTDNNEMMDISRIETEDSALVIRGTIMGAMPIDVVLTGREMRAAIPLLSGKVIWTAIRMLFSK